MSAQEFACGHQCEHTTLEVAVTAATSLPLLIYAGYLSKTKSSRRTFGIIRAVMCGYLVVRVFSVVVPSTVLYTALFVSPRQIAIFVGVFQWHKGVVDSCYKAMKLSYESPKWNAYYTVIQQTICILFFPITYGLGASPSGNPRCSALQAINSSYRWVVGCSLGVTLVFCYVVAHKEVSRLNSKQAGASGERNERFAKALKKMRKVVIVITVAIAIISATFFSSLFASGEPKVFCGSTASSIAGPMSGALGAFLLLWSTNTPEDADISSTSGSGGKSREPLRKRSDSSQSSVYKSTRTPRPGARQNRMPASSFEPRSSTPEPIKVEISAATPSPLPLSPTVQAEAFEKFPETPQFAQAGGTSALSPSGVPVSIAASPDTCTKSVFTFDKSNAK